MLILQMGWLIFVNFGVGLRDKAFHKTLSGRGVLWDPKEFIRIFLIA